MLKNVRDKANQVHFKRHPPNQFIQHRRRLNRCHLIHLRSLILRPNNHFVIYFLAVVQFAGHRPSSIHSQCIRMTIRLYQRIRNSQTIRNSHPIRSLDSRCEYSLPIRLFAMDSQETRVFDSRCVYSLAIR